MRGNSYEDFVIMPPNPQFGARPVKWVIQKNVLNELSKRILSGSVQVDKPIKIDSVGERLEFENS